MPKIIENLDVDIIARAREIIKNEGMEKLNIRRLSSELGIAPSTIYNYYAGKEEIISAIAMEQWQETLESIDGFCREPVSETEILSRIASCLKDFFKPLFAFHLSSMHKLSVQEISVSQRESGAEAFPGHSENYQKKITGELKDKIGKMLRERNHPETEAEELSEILTDLIIACIHNDSLDIKSIASALAKLK